LEEKGKRDDIEIKIGELLSIPAKHKKFIGGMTAGAAVVSLVISLLMTPIFRAETKSFPRNRAPPISPCSY
jgi:uncharacterized protein involved in exopolysaccharide biosynthesis